MPKHYKRVVCTNAIGWYRCLKSVELNYQTRTWIEVQNAVPSSSSLLNDPLALLGTSSSTSSPRSGGHSPTDGAIIPAWAVTVTEVPDSSASGCLFPVLICMWRPGFSASAVRYLKFMERRCYCHFCKEECIEFFRLGKQNILKICRGSY